ncbi:hypothetical protein [Kitasatospora azatica]|uniref:hypothetical protein n=1 Tax=Kitasatospora azatica TaxID=58347 RepID=UPI000561FFB7|nr:hypothetical protein [Kitasatospora azatica]
MTEQIPPATPDPVQPPEPVDPPQAAEPAAAPEATEPAPVPQAAEPVAAPVTPEPEPASAAVTPEAPAPATPAAVAAAQAPEAAEAPEAPALPAAPPADPWAVPDFASAPGSAPAPGQPVAPWGAEVLASPRPPRQRPRAASVLRWTAFALVLAATGTAAAVAVTTPERTKIPGLATPNDGRYAFAPLALPQLPSGKPVPSDSAAKHRHYADLRALVLPAPIGATGTAAPSASGSPAASATPSASSSPSASGSPSATGSPSAAAAKSPSTPVVPLAATADCADYAKLHEAGANVPVLLATNACRAATTRSWTAKDGTRTEIWLLRFGSEDEGRQFYDDLSANGSPKSMPQETTGINDFTLAADQLAYTRTSNVARTEQPSGKVVYLQAGDVVATVLMTNPKGVPSQAFHQVVTLQSDLLD